MTDAELVAIKARWQALPERMAPHDLTDAGQPGVWPIVAKGETQSQVCSWYDVLIQADAEAVARTFAGARADVLALVDAFGKAVWVLTGYREWEAAVIEDGRCWDDGASPWPLIAHGHYDRMLELQRAREAVLKGAGESEVQQSATAGV